MRQCKRPRSMRKNQCNIPHFGVPGSLAPWLPILMEMSKTKLGAGHPHTLMSMGNLTSNIGEPGPVGGSREASHASDLAITWKHLGRHTDALALTEDCAQARQRVLGTDHPYTLPSLATVVKLSARMWFSSFRFCKSIQNGVFFLGGISTTMQLHNHVTIGLSSLTKIMHITMYWMNRHSLSSVSNCWGNMSRDTQPTIYQYCRHTL